LLSVCRTVRAVITNDRNGGAERYPDDGRDSAPAALAKSLGSRLGPAATFATTEHFNLQTARATTVSEANGRASIYLAALSSNLIALAFIGQMSRHQRARCACRSGDVQRWRSGHGPNRSIPSPAARVPRRPHDEPACRVAARLRSRAAMGRDVDEVTAAIEQRIAAARAEIASLEVARSVLAGVDALAGKAPRPGQPEIGSVARPRSRSAMRQRRPRRPSGTDAAELKRLSPRMTEG
jgi:hypothetical protein